ncbi:MAG: hypothetical protein GAK33_05129 [Burkholderia lata]|uniref:PAAR repeat-containing protein n=1 Tax=Burkholderia lata (strain ATCC 17760 / DSM 23089 / LMG 22485 / NCIMB 9086 / R18194 / 383) TaxID=482957 RepID=A0A833U7W0_BURL3|nr:PAAR domain-containing protein [Burkholderia lata]KAF1034906.1 MAG: hypothetical protein GAK33_05129 [Burkholderia lata]
MKRYFVRIGDQTTAGGTVEQGEDSYTHDGKAVAYAGANINCPACGTIGKIENIPPHHTMLLMGKQIALDSDICVCKCTPPPRLLASQNTAFMSFEGIEPAQVELRSDEWALNTTTQSGRFDDQFKLFDAGTGMPLANKEYAILRTNGSVEHGTTDRNGCTHLLSSTTESETVHIYI